MSKGALTRVVITSEDDDPLASVRRAVAFADAMIAEGAEVAVTGDLSVVVHFDVPKPEPEPEEGS